METERIKTNDQRTSDINFSIEFADVREFAADLLVLKYSQANYGVDRIVSYDLNQVGKLDLNKISPKIGDFALVKNVGTTKYNNILFIGVPHRDEFDYKGIRNFAKDALRILSTRKPQTKHIAMTIHGSGYGLDESESIISLFLGLLEAFQLGDYPSGLQKITIVENDQEKLNRLRETMDKYLENYKFVTPNETAWSYILELNMITIVESDRIINDTKKSDAKKHIFVAMPFHEDFRDTFYFGIKEPINNNNFLCERIDQEIFTGDILNNSPYADFVLKTGV